jgi:long-chain acyl-CoA synthetase
VLVDLIEDGARLDGSRIALTTLDGDVSYAELLDDIGSAAATLAAAGVGEGDVVALVLGNSRDFVAAFYAGTWLGAVVLPLNRQFQELELVQCVTESGAAVVVADAESEGLCRKVADAVGSVRVVVGVSASGGEPPPRADGRGDRDALFQYSSGSTGPSKRAVRTLDALRAEADDFHATTGVGPDDVFCCTVPLFHAHGLGNALLASARAGGRLVLLDGLARTTILELIESLRVTTFPGTPFIFRVLADMPRVSDHDLSSVRLCFSAGGPLPRSTYDDFQARTGLSIRNLYGCTEAGSVTLNTDEDVDATAESVGRAMSGVRVDVLDGDGNPLPPGQVGEVAITSPALFRGYLTGDTVDRTAFRGDAYVSGDLGSLDADGRLFLAGRRTKYINTPGNKVDPEEVEASIARLPGVEEVVVLGVPSRDGTEMVKAVVVASGPLTSAEVVDACRSRIAEFKVPRIVEFRDELPKNPMGKILRKYLQ